MAVDKEECLDNAVKITEAYAGHAYSGTAGQKINPAKILEDVYRKLVELAEDVNKE